MLYVVLLRSFVCFTLATSLLLVSCSQNVEESAAFQDHGQRLDRLDEDLKALSIRLASIDTDFQAVSEDVARMVSGGGGDSGAINAIKALEQRIQGLEQTVKASQAVLAARQEKPKVATPETAPEEKLSAGDAGAEAQRPKVVARKNPSAQSNTAVPEKPAVPSGSYHMVKTGDTIQTIANQYKTSMNAILMANRLPGDAKVLPGQRIYVPMGK